MKKLLSKFNLKPWMIILPAIIIAGIIIVKMFRKPLGALGAVLTRTFTGVDTVMKDIFRSFGLDEDLNDKVSQATGGATNNPWSSEYYRYRQFTTYMEDNAPGVLVDVENAWNWWNADGNKLQTVFAKYFHTRCEFSQFCEYFANQKGVNFAEWLLSGWCFGLVGSMGKAQFEWYINFINNLQEQENF